jgi:tRNA A-37 threonylcarbamoyl transferase component Bud32
MGAPPIDTFRCGEYLGEIVRPYRPAEPVPLEEEVLRLIDPANAIETLHWGRNYIYTARLAVDGQGDGLPVVVKQFRDRPSWLQRLERRRRGSKALRSWRVARAFQEADLPTAEPVILLEPEDPRATAYFVTRHLGEVMEARYLLRAANENRHREAFPDIDLEAFLDALGGLLRRMHEARFWHRDLSIGNVLLVREEGATGGGSPGVPPLFIVDLNRTRMGKRLTVSERTRDLCRLAIFRPEDQDRFLKAYWQDDLTPFRRWLYRFYHRGFLRRIRTKKQLRGGLRSLLEPFRPRTAHAHIPKAPEGASSRDKIVWDALSDQPHQHAGRLEKLRVRLGDVGAHAVSAGLVLRKAPGLWRKYRQLQRTLYREPVPFDGIGLCVRPWPEDPEAVLAAVEQLGVRRLLLRLHPWQEDHGPEEDLARELFARGHELAFALPQNRDLVKDPQRWQAAVTELAERFTPYGRHFQVGQAINRSKWGVWSYGEYLELAARAVDVLRPRTFQGEPVEILGPSVIDFEYHATVAVLNRRRRTPEGRPLHFDIVSALLYVDRRGAPENRQAGLDTVDKVTLLKAVAETAASSSGRCWVTEFNWPLWEGPHSPAGRDVSVDEASQANYLVRYYILALATGMVERAYWWQLIARGYGLMSKAGGENGELRHRPGFGALATLSALLGGSWSRGPLPEVGEAVRAYRFEREGELEVVVGWAVSGRGALTLPRPAERAVSRDGHPLPVPDGVHVVVEEAPVYFVLKSP